MNVEWKTEELFLIINYKVLFELIVVTKART